MVVAQIAPKPAATPAPAPVPAGAVVTTPFAAPREIVELSPFVVNTDKDAGFSAGVQDSYSLERYEISRGPNAALFSIGGNTALGGGMGGQTKKARYDRPAENVAVSYGSWDYKRTTLDVNRPLSDKLAVRANAVWFDRGGWRLNEFEQTRGVTVAASSILS